MILEVLLRLFKLDVNKSALPDDIFPRILYEANEQLAYLIIIWFKTSLSVKTLPEDWFSANVVPVFKKGDKKEALNYRPISLTCIIYKILESVIREAK